MNALPTPSPLPSSNAPSPSAAVSTRSPTLPSPSRAAHPAPAPSSSPTSPPPSPLLPSLCLYHVPLLPGTSIPFCLYGHFTSAHHHEFIVFEEGHSLSLYRMDNQHGDLLCLCTTPLFSQVVAASTVQSSPGTSTAADSRASNGHVNNNAEEDERVLGARDTILLTSDSGYLSVLMYDDKSMGFRVVQHISLAKSGLRRHVPLLGLAVDPLCRAVMTHALDTHMLAMIITTSANGSNTTTASTRMPLSLSATKSIHEMRTRPVSQVHLSSPLEANRPHWMRLAIAALDVGLDNPLFAALEVDCAQEDESFASSASVGFDAGKSVNNVVKHISFYELDLSLNHITRKHSKLIDSSAHLLLTVPGQSSIAHGPGGVLALCQNYLLYISPSSISHTASGGSSAISPSPLQCYFPRRHGIDIEPSLIIISHTCHIQKNSFFFLLQSEHGDLYKLTFTLRRPSSSDSMTDTDHSAHRPNEWLEGLPEVEKLTLSYFDSIAPASSLSIVRSGFLFAASECSEHAMFQFVGLGDDVEAVDYVSCESTNSSDYAHSDWIYFHTRSNAHRNLSLVYTMRGRHPIIAMRSVGSAFHKNGAQHHLSPLMFLLSGTAQRSQLTCLRHGIPLLELASTVLHTPPRGVFTIVDKQQHDTNIVRHSMIALSFATTTIILSVGDTVNEVNNTGLLENVSSLYVGSLYDHSLVQVYQHGLRQVRVDTKRFMEWHVPDKKQIAHVAANERSLLIALTGGDLIYFELDRVSGTLTDMYKKVLMREITALCVSPVEEGNVRGRFMAIACEHEVRIFSADPTSPFQEVSTMMFSQPISSLLIQQQQLTSGSVAMAMFTGQVNGVLTRSRLDPVTAQLSEHRRRFLGARPVNLQPCVHNNCHVVLACSDRSWLDMHSQHKSGSMHSLYPLAYEAFDSAAYLSTEKCPDGLVAVVGSNLRIFSFDHVTDGEPFHEVQTRLRYTPRKIEVLPGSGHVLVLETDHNAYNSKERDELEAIVMQSDDIADIPAVSNHSQPSKSLPPEQLDFFHQYIGMPYAGAGHWASCLSIQSPRRMGGPLGGSSTLFVHEFDGNEAAFSLALCHFDLQNGPEQCLAVGCVRDLQLRPRSLTSASIVLFEIDALGTAAKLLHRTIVHDVPNAMTMFQRRLLVGLGRSLRLYDYGKRQLLRKGDYNDLPGLVHSLFVAPDGERVCVGTMTEGFVFLHYSNETKRFHAISNSAIPRFLSAALPLDADTVAGADKFGNLFVCRLPAAVTDQESSTHVSTTASVNGHMNPRIPAQNKLQDLINFHCCSIITAMSLVDLHTSPASLAQEQRTPVLLCATISGSILAFRPIHSKREIELLTQLELHMRASFATHSLTHRDHLSFRSAYLPVKGVVDGALLQTFPLLPIEKQNALAAQLNVSAERIIVLLEDMRSNIC